MWSHLPPLPLPIHCELVVKHIPAHRCLTLIYKYKLVDSSSGPPSGGQTDSEAVLAHLQDYVLLK